MLLQSLLTRAREGAALEKLVASASAPRGHAWYALTWLLKYVLLRLD